MLKYIGKKSRYSSYPYEKTDAWFYICKECGSSGGIKGGFKSINALGKHIMNRHPELGSEGYYRKHYLQENEDLCQDCSEPLLFYGLARRFLPTCHSCKQSRSAAQCNKNGKITESLLKREESFGFGRIGYVKTPEHRAAISKMLHKRWSVAGAREELSERMKEAWKNPEMVKKFSGSWGPQGNGGLHVSPKAGTVRYRSSWELEAYKNLDSNDSVATYITEPFAIPYTFQDIEKNYYPDILIKYKDGSAELIEIKPFQFLEQENVKAKLEAGESFCGMLGIRFSVWTQNSWPLSQVRLL